MLTVSSAVTPDLVKLAAPPASIVTIIPPVAVPPYAMTPFASVTVNVAPSAA